MDMRENAQLAIDLINAVDRERFVSDRPLVYSVIHAVSIVGEAAAQLDAGLRAEFGMLPWRDAINMRNKLIHGYRTVKATIVFDTVRSDFPALVAELDRILDEKAPC